MTPENAAWFAGIYEGEGTTYIAASPSHSQMVTRIGMSDEDIITRIADLWGGIGTTTLNQPSYAGSKPCHRWQVTKRDDLAVVWDVLWPWLGERRRQQIVDTFETFMRYSNTTRRPWAPPTTRLWAT